MDRIQVAPGTKDVSVLVHLHNTADGTNATGKSASTIGLVYQRGSAGTPLQIIDIDLAAVTDPHTDGGVIEIQAGNYRIDLPDVVCSEGESVAYFFVSSSGAVQTGGALAIDLAPKPQLRVNSPAGMSFRRLLSSRHDGTHKVSAPIKIRAGTVGDIAVSVDMRLLLGDQQAVSSVGTPTVAPAGDITVTAAGPRDTQAMVILGGTASASSEYTVTIPVAMDTGEAFSIELPVTSFAT